MLSLRQNYGYTIRSAPFTVGSISELHTNKRSRLIFLKHIFKGLNKRLAHFNIGKDLINFTLRLHSAKKKRIIFSTKVDVLWENDMFHKTKEISTKNKKS